MKTNKDLTVLNDQQLEQVAGGNTPHEIWCPYGCLTPDTAITLADGSSKRADELNDTDMLLAWDFDEGRFTEAPITFFHRVYEEAPVLRVSFSDGTSVGVVLEHCFFDLTDRRFVAVNSERQKEALKGHRFAKLTGGKLTEATLTDIVADGTTDSYFSPVTAAHFNCFAEGLLSVSGFMKGLYNVFELEENALKYDAGKKAADLKKFGELPYEAFAAVASRALYERNRAGWFGVAVAKGLTSAEELVKLFDFCRPFFVGEKKAA